MKISKKAAAVTPSATMEITAKAKAMKKEGVSVIAFTAGEPDFNTPQYIDAAAKEAIDKGYTKYTHVAGIKELKRAIVEKFARRNGLNYNEEQIVVSTGAKSSLYHAVYAVIDDGDEVVVPAPYWVTYTEQIKMAGGVCKIVNTTEKSGYKLVKEQFEEAITPKTKCVIINSPCNPTGAVYTKKELKDIADVCEKYGLIAISDEIYEDLVFDGNTHVSLASVSDYMKQNTIVIGGVSKSYAMTGWRIGYLAAPTEVAKAISGVQSHTTSNACTISQYAAFAALTGEGGEEFIRNMSNEFDERRKFIVQKLSEIDGLRFPYPVGAFYVFVDVSAFYGKKLGDKSINDSLSFANALLLEGVAVVPGVAFGFDNFVRLSYTITREEIEEGVKRIKNFVEKLN